MSLGLESKVALVTGSGRGIGRAIAAGLAREGATVVVNAIHAETVSRVVDELKVLGHQAIPAVQDISTSEGVASLFEVVAKTTGKLDILVNNAGINIPKAALDLSEEEWDRVNSVNLRSVFLCSRAAAERFLIPQRSGKIINIASLLGVTPSPNRAAYSVTKAGVIMLTKELALEWAKHHVNVNAIAPGFFLTDLLAARIKEGAVNEAAILKRIPIGRLGDLADISNLANFLASDRSNYITGQVILVDGGYSVNGAPE